jgi:Asp-tRNA(Asn)/Glu-tRNA(Gln) amidotransferase A subunit family amidase
MQTTIAHIDDLANLSLAQLIQAYRQQSIDPVEVMQLTLAQINLVNSKINALYDVDAQQLITAAESAALRFKTGQAQQPLAGIPVSIKDSIHALNMHWHHGSAAHQQGIVSQFDAPPVQRLKAQQAIILGKTTMPDYGMSASGVSSYHGITRNPWNLSFSPGGSSAGAGASLAAGIGMFSVGTDIAGSVRLPAAHCGLAAIKPTQGILAHSPASDVRSAGIMARSAHDLSMPLSALSGVHPADRYSLALIDSPDPAPIHLAVYHTFGFGAVPEADVIRVLDQACDVLDRMHNIVLQHQDFAYPEDPYLAIDASLKLRAWQEYQSASAESREYTSAPLIAWFAEVADWGLQQILTMQKGLQQGIQHTASLFEKADVLLSPVMPVVNFSAELLGPDQGIPLGHCRFTAVFNQSGHPAVVIHAGYDRRGLPIGLQLVGQRCSDLALIRLACRLEDALRQQGLSRPWPTDL